MSKRTTSRAARALVWQLARRWRRRDHRSLRWPALASIWVHLAVGTAVLLVDPGAESAPPDGPLSVARISGDHRAPDGATAEGADAGARGQAAPGADPDPAAATGTPPSPRDDAPTPADTREAPQRRDRADLPPPPEPDRPADEPDAWLRFARTEAEDAGQAPVAPIAISAHDQRADQLRRAPVTSDRLGPLTPLADSPHDDDGAPTLQRHEGAAAPRLGNRPDVDPQPIPVGGGGGGGHHGVRSGDGSTGAAGDRLAGGALARSGSGRSAATATATSGTRPAAGTPTPAADATRPAVDAPSWWRPTVSRVRLPPRDPVPTVAAVAEATPSPTRGRGVALRDALDDGADRGGTDEVEEEAALPTETLPAVGRRRVAPPGTADPAEELREALGFGPVDRTQLGPRPEWAGELALRGQQDSSPRTPFDDVPIDWTTTLDTVGTPLGRWVQRAEEIVVDRWTALDLDTHQRAIGIGGQVTVRYVVRPGGRVTHRWVERSSGNAALDRMALSAIPERLPRLPREVDDALHHRITLRYRNPLVSAAP